MLAVGYVYSLSFKMYFFFLLSNMQKVSMVSPSSADLFLCILEAHMMSCTMGREKHKFSFCGNFTPASSTEMKNVNSSTEGAV